VTGNPEIAASCGLECFENLCWSLRLGHPLWGTHKKMTEMNEQELHEFMRLKHHSHGLKNQQLG
jgi:hypothetical protein